MHNKRTLLRSRRSALPLILHFTFRFTLNLLAITAIGCPIVDMHNATVDDTWRRSCSEDSARIFDSVPKLLDTTGSEDDNTASSISSNSCAESESVLNAAQYLLVCAGEGINGTKLHASDPDVTNDGINLDAQRIPINDSENRKSSGANDAWSNQCALRTRSELLSPEYIYEHSMPLAEAPNLQCSTTAECYMSFSLSFSTLSPIDYSGSSWVELVGIEWESAGSPLNNSWSIQAIDEGRTPPEVLHTMPEDIETLLPEPWTSLSDQLSLATSERTPCSPRRSNALTPLAPTNIRHSGGSDRRKRVAYTAGKKEKVNAVRKASACIRCQMLKEAVRAPGATHKSLLIAL
jgi:hypothetical protein